MSAIQNAGTKSIIKWTKDVVSSAATRISRNSYSRKSLWDKCPYDLFEFLYGYEFLKLIECDALEPIIHYKHRICELNRELEGYEEAYERLSNKHHG